MTPNLNVHSFDPPRDRPAPDSLSGHWTNGDEVVIALTRPTLLIAVKADCDGCREFMNASSGHFDQVDVVIVAALDEPEWADCSPPVLISPGALHVLDVRSAPFYVLIDPVAQTVLTEGVIFGPSQVAEEIAPFTALPVHNERDT